jgi:glycosyltransferase involved in cell wall biosynthesis
MPPSPDGAGAIPRLLHAQVMGLARRNDVTVITVAGPDPRELDAVDAMARGGLDVRAARRQEPVGVSRWRRRGRLLRGWVVRRYPWRTAWYWEPSLQDALDRRLEEGPVDVVQAEDNAMGIYRYGDAARVLSEYEVRRPRARELGGPIRTLGRRAVREEDWQRWTRYQRAVWARFDRLQVFTDRDAQLMRGISPAVADRIVVNPFGVELPPVSAPDRAEPGRILFAGNYSHPPNVDAARWLVGGIMPLVRARHPHARLALVGEQAPPDLAQTRSAGVDFLGGVPEVRPWLERAEVVVAPVRTGNGMRMKVLEALASGKAVVTTTRGAEGFGEEPPLRVADDAVGFALAIGDLLDDDDGRRALEAAARRHAARRHSPDAWAERLERVHRDAMEAARRRTRAARP